MITATSKQCCNCPFCTCPIFFTDFQKVNFCIFLFSTPFFNGGYSHIHACVKKHRILPHSIHFFYCICCRSLSAASHSAVIF